MHTVRAACALLSHTPNAGPVHSAPRQVPTMYQIERKFDAASVPARPAETNSNSAVGEPSIIAKPALDPSPVPKAAALVPEASMPFQTSEAARVRL